MDFGDAGHILLSKRVADDLSPYPKWNRHLHNLGDFDVKHGERVGLVNFFTDVVGNPERPRKCERAKQSRSIVHKLAVAAIVAPLILIGGLGLWRYHTSKTQTANDSSLLMISPKSIAVLPFENLSEDKANAFFADGVQDEILTKLAKIADLKVISRSSVMQYRSGVTRNMREIGKQLGVVHLLEGRVQRAGAKVRVNAQLIDTRTDDHVWAQTYDRDLADVFAIQSEIAGEIAQQLQAKLAPEEKTRLAAKPTSNTEAYLLYLQANELVPLAASKQDAINADNLYAEAIKLDPGFALARARASMLNSFMYAIGREPERKLKARTLADEARRLAPDLPEGHLATGLYYYRTEGNYDEALKELARARAALPNDSEILTASGVIYRRQGRWQGALDAFQRGHKLNPRRAYTGGLPTTYKLLRRWQDAIDTARAAIEVEPQRLDAWGVLIDSQFGLTGNPSQAVEAIERLPETLKIKLPAKGAKWDYAMLARDFDAAEKNVPDMPPEEFPNAEAKAFYEACVATVTGDTERAHALLETIRPIYENGVKEHPNDAPFHAALARLYALLARANDAVTHAQRAVELCPESKDAVFGPAYTANLAFVYARAGKSGEAVKLLSRLLTVPAPERITLSHLRLSWEWDPIRNHPGFQKLIAGPEPKTVYK
jgi:TolB-like protein/Flp pilus assembly protein TadD